MAKGCNTAMANPHFAGARWHEFATPFPNGALFKQSTIKNMVARKEYNYEQLRFNARYLNQCYEVEPP
ncbi:hypothetical protein COU12_00830 [Candidatus Jorgensenbacteria bacterium CG10_big_fil_rev_8_21_14_0_10_54_38]|uniref:Uncharacterized protein n=2 Tax=Candidatus Joergenseniibacteriota TaxID=1752739 RepID=A0A2M6WG72_9BACT|nr:MAG: hypothetical protein COX26_01185 [Candidatus Jorgensenbacteria bacterium CG23_combo_of_CG06-09_8_20_14_all_54_14]PIT91813.1 MAG: hypothetical protein COU12_00830 [Candidatus Jorgensenbacteria bacterium CG10_big_fil_rev_8_21_14_0_10_54_38]PIU29898.1 MAG: hypothetical protein COT07_03550 [Candidatus Woesearchaeota archaeon CG07_land_8_20_14_0_80_44_23]